MTQLEKEVLDIIEKVTCCKYIGHLKVIESEDDFTLNLYLNQEMSPMVINYQGDKESFLKFIAKDLRKRQIERAHHFRAIKHEWYESQCIDTDDYCNNDTL